MCGIIGVVESSNCAGQLIDGLKKLEYRGYDSAGISLLINGAMVTQKNVGRVDHLERNVALIPMMQHAKSGIGHTRWATHGAPSDINSHPFCNADNTLSIVHNGIIENYQPIKEFLISHGYIFTSHTDSEVIIHLIDYYYKLTQDIAIAFFIGVKALVGSFALCLLDVKRNQILAVKKDSPLIIGLGDTTYIASDKCAIEDVCSEYMYLSDYEFAFISKDKLTITNIYGEIIQKEIFKEEKSASTDIGLFKHYMVKEIYEQPRSIDLLIDKYLSNDENIIQAAAAIKMAFDVTFIGCGSAFYAASTGKEILSKVLGQPLYCELASEFRYKQVRLNKNSVCIFVSQSGETADTLAALRLAKSYKAKTIALVSVSTSALAKEADLVLQTYCGKEIAVASTKAYSAQLFNFILVYLSIEKNELLESRLQTYGAMLEDVLHKAPLIEDVANRINANQFFYIGRQLDYNTCLEGALKLKEIAYATTYALAAGELKHGPLALVDKNTCVIALVTDRNILNKTLSNILEVKSRGSMIMIISPFVELEKHSDIFILTAETDPILMTILSNMYLQLFAYYYALKLKVDIDKPRNLAKSVTVE